MPAADAKAFRLTGRTVFGLVLWVALLRAPFLFVDPFGWDEGFYMIAGAQLLKGQHLYVDIWDYKPVGIFLIYAAIMLVSGNSVSAVVVASALAVLATTLLLAKIGGRVFGRPRAGLYAAILFPAYMLVTEGYGANAENFFIVFGALSMLLLGSHLSQPREMAQHRKVAFLFGLIQGVALQIKFLTAPETAFLGLVFGLVVLSERRRLLDGVQLFASFIAAFLLPTLIVFAWFWRIGAIHEMVLANFISPAYYAKSAFGLADPIGALKEVMRAAYGQAPLMLAAAISLVAVVVLAIVRLPARAAVPYWLLLAWLLGAVFSSSYTGNFFDHYFIVLAPPLSLLAALGIDRIGSEGSGRLLRVGAVAALVAFPVFLDVWSLSKRLGQPILNPAWAIAAEVRRLVPGGTPIYVLNLTPEIYILSDTVPTGRFAFSWQISEERFVPFGIDVADEIRKTFAPKPVLIVAQRDYLEEQATRITGLFNDIIRRDYDEVRITDEALTRRVLIFRRRADR
jgi:4-amino-4-deoxy-L-arabinose transferase-like glycosyltransferase